MAVLLETNIGDLVIDLYTDKAPTLCTNFLKLCKIKYYHFCTFFSVQKDYIAVTGDPTGSGSGGDNIFHIIDQAAPQYLPDEMHPDVQKHNIKGIVATSNSGPNLNNSQFYITLTSSELPYLNGKHSVFGKVAEGLDVLDKINNVYCDKSGKPFQAIFIKHTHVIDDPFPDPVGLIMPPASPKQTADLNLAFDLALDKELKKKSEEEVKKETEHHEAKTRAIVLEMLEDIPDADIAPPENVLFVCKLNPVTQEEDLELIFSRFGAIKSCDVIRDKKTGDSLQYAFIEYERKEDCVEAYFHMQNALIDERRIHVDFSQSVVHEWASYRRKQLAEYAKKMVNKEVEKGAEEKNEVAESYQIKTQERPRDDRYKLVFEEKSGSGKHKQAKALHRGKEHASRSNSRERHKHHHK